MNSIVLSLIHPQSLKIGLLAFLPICLKDQDLCMNLPSAHASRQSLEEISARNLKRGGLTNLICARISKVSSIGTDFLYLTCKSPIIARIPPVE